MQYRTQVLGKVKIDISQTKAELGHKAAAGGAHLIRDAIREKGTARIVLASAASQFEVVEALVCECDIDWAKVEVFHLDEYVGMSMDHPASFRKFLKERFIEKLPEPIGAMHYIAGEAEVDVECNRLGDEIRKGRIDVAFIGIGENGHLAFNDPPADFETTEPYIVVQLDQACREQQIGEGWFPDVDSVPKTAISMSIRQILDSRNIVCCVPDTRKARAIRDAAQGPITPDVPASILQRHSNATLFLDTYSAALLDHA